MADKRIDELLAAEEMSDSALLVVYQDGETKSVSGEKVRGYAESAAQDEIGEKFSSMTIATGEPDTNASYDPATNTMTIPRGKQGAAGAGSGDMIASIYDPQGKSQDIFAYVDKAISAFEAPAALVKLFELTVTEATNEIAIDLSGVDLSRYLKLTLQGVLPAMSSNYACCLVINGDTTRGSYGRGCLEFEDSSTNRVGAVSDESYIIMGESLTFDGGSFFEESFCDTGAHLVCVPSGHSVDLDSKPSGAALLHRWDTTLWRNGGLKDVQTMLIQHRSVFNWQVGQLPAGTRFLLTGWKM